MKSGLLLTTSLIAAAWAMDAHAQAPAVPGSATNPAQSPTGGEAQTPATAPAPAGQGNPLTDANTPLDADVATEQAITVTGSRIANAGFQAPTPVTVASTEQLLAATPTTLGDALRQLPALNASVGPRGAQTSGGQGGAFLNLRNLGPIRTLTLLDGRRFVPQGGSGLVDTNLFPQALVSRVEVVTGGASAAYGSDAVAGVVNFILDKDFTGFKGDVQGGVSSRGDGWERRASLSYGTGFGADDAGHILANVEYFKADEISERLSRPVARRSCGIIPLPAGSATLRDFACNIRVADANFNGLITSPSSLRGTTFDVNGNPIPFNYGTLVTSGRMVGGDGVIPEFAPLSAGVDRRIGFLRASYDVADDTTVFLEANVGRIEITYQVGSFSNTLGNTALTIQRDNAFLPASLRDRMVAANVTSFRLGKYLNELPKSQVTTVDDTLRVVGGVDGKIAGLDYGAYVEVGRNKRNLKIFDDLILPNYFRAIDAIVDPSTGRIRCRSEVGARAGCIPVTPFGTPQLTDDQRNYIVGTNINDLTAHEYAAAFNVSGQPFSTWAGAVSLAAGAEYRKQDFSQTVDDGSVADNFVTNGSGIYRVGNARPQSGSYNIKEAFVEAAVPLARDTLFLQELDLNAAARYTDYSTSGTVTTWKVGATWRPFDGLRLRGTRSRDIRAPVLNELFQAGVTNFIPSVFDPIRNVQVNNARSITLGNPRLRPEKADTLTAGVVFTPGFIPRFNLSVDYYDIEIDGAITTPTAARVLDDCRLGAQELCDRIFRDAAGNLLTIELVPLNLQVFETSGIDIEASYRLPLDRVAPALGGDLSFRVLANYVDKYVSRLEGAAAQNRAGDSGTAPHWRGVAQVNYDNGPLGLFLQARYTGPGWFDQFTTPNDLRQLRVKAQTVWNGRVSYQLPIAGGDWTAFLNVNNIFDKLPPDLVPTAGQYDPVGRFFRFGVRFTY